MPTHFFTALLTVFATTAAAMWLGAAVLHLIPKLGPAGRRASAALCRAPALDLVITYFTIAPLAVGPAVAGWAGLVGALAGQVAGVLGWTLVHEMIHRREMRGPRIFKVVNRMIGRWRNHTAAWLTATVTPLFFFVRLAETFVYPPITWLTGLPRYNQPEWVNVSRHKFKGLVGHDLIWCLYCDWMTGVWSLGTEMLRNVESFWCPIRFDTTKKCVNCTTDFPDVSNGWVDAGGTMEEVTSTIERMYGDCGDGQRSWFGHPVRLRIRVKGHETPEETPAEAEMIAK